MSIFHISAHKIDKSVWMSVVIICSGCFNEWFEFENNNTMKQFLYPFIKLTNHQLIETDETNRKLWLSF